MNTGIQKSSLTPFGAKTTTTPAGANAHGCLTQKKNLFEIVAAHGIPYAATASVGYLPDFIRKVERARAIRGTRYLHVIAPWSDGLGLRLGRDGGHREGTSWTAACGIWPSTRASRYAAGPVAASSSTATRANSPAWRRTCAAKAASARCPDDEVAAVDAARDAKWEAMRREWV